MVYSPKICRMERRCTPRTVREWIACRTQHADLTLEQIAERAHVPPRFLRAYSQDGGKHIPAATLARVCAVVGDFSAFDLLLEPHGLRTTTISARSSKSLADEAIDVAASVGDVMGEVRSAVADGTVDDDERARIRRSIRETRRELDELDARVVSGPVLVAKERA